MGWDFMHREPGLTHLEFFQREVSPKIIAAEEANGAVYAAYQTDKGVIALAMPIRRVPGDYFNFGWKLMGEGDEPFYYDCPKAIFDLLTPYVSDSEYATERSAAWRAKVRANLDSQQTIGRPVWQSQGRVGVQKGPTGEWDPALLR